MAQHFRVIVVGLGAMGSAALYQLAKREVNVLGIDRFTPPHTLGSTHGDTRITRRAIGEGENYTPLAMRSYELFQEIERTADTKLLEITGELIISSDRPSSANERNQLGFLEQTISDAERYNIPHEVLDANAIRKRFPQFTVAADEKAYYEPGAGILRPERAVQTQIELARSCGARIHLNETFRGFTDTACGIVVSTESGQYETDYLILSVGPWLPELLPEFSRIFTVNRQVLYWFDVSNAYDDFIPGKMPVFDWHLKSGRSTYGFPALDGRLGGVKIATESYAETVTPDSVDRMVRQDEIDAMYASVVAPHFPAVSSTCIKSAVCLYTVTPDCSFVIDRHLASDKILICSPCSGHGFKHSAGIGEALADIITTGAPRVDLSSFSLNRFLTKTVEFRPRRFS